MAKFLSAVLAAMLVMMLASCQAVSSSATQPVAKKGKHPSDAVFFQGHWYKVFDGGDSWHERKKLCENMGGYLACVTSQAQQDFITKLADGKYLSLGGTNEADKVTWKWVNGKPWKFEAWYPGQPNNYGEVEYWLATYDGGLWCDVAASGDGFWMPTGYICQWDQ